MDVRRHRRSRGDVITFDSTTIVRSRHHRYRGPGRLYQRTPRAGRAVRNIVGGLRRYRTYVPYWFGDAAR